MREMLLREEDAAGRFLADRSAAVHVKTPEGEPGIVYAEMKYSEDMTGRPARWRERYDQALKEVRLYKDPNSRPLRSVPGRVNAAFVIYANELLPVDDTDRSRVAFRITLETFIDAIDVAGDLTRPIACGAGTAIFSESTTRPSTCPRPSSAPKPPQTCRGLQSLPILGRMVFESGQTAERSDFAFETSSSRHSHGLNIARRPMICRLGRPGDQQYCFC